MASPPGGGITVPGLGISGSGGIGGGGFSSGSSADPYTLVRASELAQFREAVQIIRDLRSRGVLSRLRKTPQRGPSSFLAEILGQQQVSGSDQYEYSWRLVKYTPGEDTDDDGTVDTEPKLEQRSDALSSYGLDPDSGQEGEFVKPAYWATKAGVWGDDTGPVGDIVLMHRVATEYGDPVYVFTTLGPMWEGWAKITGSASIGGESYRWKYAWSEQEPDGDDFANKTGGRSGTTSTDYAINTMENGNTSSNVGPGVDPTGTDYAASSFAPQAISSNAVVWMRHTVSYDSGTNTLTDHYHFTAENAHDGDC